MNHIGARKTAIYYLRKYGLEKRGWRFRWDRAQRRFGACWYSKKCISLSWDLVVLNPFEQVRDTTLHEIAHALAFVHDGERGHGAKWKRWCIRVGANPERCYGNEVQDTNNYRYVLAHKDTGEVFKRYYRKPQRECWERIWIQGRKAETFGKLELKRI